MDTDAKLVHMAEQIVANNRASGDADIIAGVVADHLNRFWDPRMRSAILRHAAEPGTVVSPELRLALARVHAPGAS